MGKVVATWGASAPTANEEPRPKKEAVVRPRTQAASTQDAPTVPPENAPVGACNVSAKSAYGCGLLSTLALLAASAADL